MVKKKMANRKSLYLLSVSLLLMVVLAQSLTITRASPVGTPYPLQVTLHGSGASFPAPIINFWAQNYTASHPNVTISYASVGSGAGQLAAADKNVDFATSDAPISTNNRPLYPNILHIPETIGSVVLAYNVPGVTAHLNLTGALIANIYLGQVHLWDDAAIQSLNPNIVLPHQNITTVHRFDGSGTTFVFTSYLASVSATWASTCGTPGTAWPSNCQGSPTCTPFPCAITGNGNAGVANQIISHTYSFGYVELNYAITQTMIYGAVRNADNSAYVVPTNTTTFYAVSNYTSTHTLPQGIQDWSGVSMLNQAGLSTYPIASFTYLLVYRELNVLPSMNLNETTQAQALIGFLNWIITTGQKYADLKTLNYVALPPSVVAVDQASINSITYTITSKSVHKTFSLQASLTTGWNGINPGPQISVVSGDLVTLLLTSGDGATHQWFLDFNNNGVIDSNENNTTVSPLFSSTTTATNFTFSPLIFNSHSVPSLGNWTYRDSQHPSITGTFRIIPQQVAIPFRPPANSLASVLVPILDTSKVTTQGSLIADLRTNVFSGSLTEATVDSTSGAPTSTQVYQLSNLQLLSSSGVLQSMFVIKAAVSPKALSSNIVVKLTGLTGTATYTVTREMDIAAQGTINIVDIATIAFHFGTTSGQANYSDVCDLDANGTIDIIDVATAAFYFGVQAFS